MVMHRGTDPEAIKIANKLGLLFDGMQPMIEEPSLYQFTVATGEGQGITFAVPNLSQVEDRLKFKLREFGISQGMSEEEKWEKLMASIRKAAHILNEDLTERDMPEYLNWPVGTDMNKRLWAQVHRKRAGKMR